MARNATYPVEIGPLVTGDRHRHVRIERPGSAPVWEACATGADLVSALTVFRPDLDLGDESQVHWVGSPGQWPQG
ncbi:MULTISPECIES: hypothetical protein [Streptacidiphilus]|uniref:Uncharacterized protein n=2 Tax=Streptacidiphilus TaxID=228398 RepID=A0ABV6UTG5_9ACTN|nr:hypothetical protein [Streptacidiphilus jeojiense]